MNALFNVVAGPMCFQRWRLVPNMGAGATVMRNGGSNSFSLFVSKEKVK